MSCAPEIAALAARYCNMLERKGILPLQQDGGSQSLEHAHWMLRELQNPSVVRSHTKQHRWIGFCQAVLCQNDVTTVAVEREHTRTVLNGL